MFPARSPTAALRRWGRHHFELDIDTPIVRAVIHEIERKIALNTGYTTVRWPENTGFPTTNLHRTSLSIFTPVRWYYQYVPYFSFESGLAGAPTVTSAISAVTATTFGLPLLAGVWNRREGSWFADLADMNSVMLSASDLADMVDESAAVLFGDTTSLLPGATCQDVNATL